MKLKKYILSNFFIDRDVYSIPEHILAYSLGAVTINITPYKGLKMSRN